MTPTLNNIPCSGLTNVTSKNKNLAMRVLSSGYSYNLRLKTFKEERAFRLSLRSFIPSSVTSPDLSQNYQKSFQNFGDYSYNLRARTFKDPSVLRPSLKS